MRVDIVDSDSDLHYCYLRVDDNATFTEGFGVTLVFNSTVNSFRHTKDAMVEGPLTITGERECRHYKLRGSAFAIPSNFVYEQKNEDVKILGYHSTVTQSQPVVRLTDNQGKKVNVGPASFNGSLTSYTQVLPDRFYIGTGLKKHYRKIKFLFLKKSESMYQLRLTYEYNRNYKIPEPTIGWVPSESVLDFEVDSRQFRYRGGSPVTDLDLGWRDMPVIRKVQPLSTTPFSPSLLPSSMKAYSRLATRIRRTFVTPDDGLVYGDLVRRCANDARVIPTNSIELAMELRVIVESLKAALGLATGNVNVKNFASAWLSYKYGLRLTVAGLKTVSDGLTKKIREIDSRKARSRAMERVVARRTSVTKGGDLMIDFNYKITYLTCSNDVRDSLRRWFDSGLFPSLTNTWDLIPLSFVLDWFLKVESYLDSIDANTYWSTYQILGSIYTKKETFRDVGWVFSNPDWSLSGDISLVYYDRRFSRHVHKPTFFDPSPRDFHNYAELASLIIVLKQ